MPTRKKSGYNGVAAMVDSKHQIVVHAEATGDSEPTILRSMAEKTQENFQEIGKEDNVFKNAKFTADSGFHSEKNMESNTILAIPKTLQLLVVGSLRDYSIGYQK